MTVQIRASQDGATATFHLRGEIDLANHVAVEEQLTRAISNEATLVRVDLTEVSFIDSSGLRVLFALTTRLERLQIGLELVAPEASPARRVIELSGLASLVTVRTDLA